MLQLKFIKKDILKRVKFEPKPKPKKKTYVPSTYGLFCIPVTRLN